MNETEKTGRASEPADLRARICDVNVPKTEAEWWAQAEIARLRARVAQLEGALFNATALIGHAMPMDTTALVAGEKLVARDVWNAGSQALGGSDGR
jgi:hypothetical protein